MHGNQYICILNVLVASVSLAGIFLMLASGAIAGGLQTNVALNQNTQQSTISIPGYGGRAVDGNRDPTFQHGSCTRTTGQSDPWWRVTLPNVYKIAAVIITNADVHEHRLNGAEIWIGNSENTLDSRNVRCAVISHIPKGRSVYFPCSGMEARYVHVILPGSNKVLSLCEVEVYTTNYAYPLPNVALKGDATQSSTLSFAAASKAIDGRRNSFYSHGSCSHTAERRTNPWWRVDLGRAYTIMTVKITNRGDCCAERLDGAEILIGDSEENNGNNNPRCASIPHIRAGKTQTYHCNNGSMAGRFVNVFLPGDGKTLTLCEVEVYAIPPVEPLPNVALNKPTMQSSTDTVYKENSSHVVDGCRSGFNSHCCSQTRPEKYPFWRLDLTSERKISALTVINRLDCCSERLTGAEVWVGSSTTHHHNPRCGVISSLGSTAMYTFQCDVKGRYVFVIIPGDNRILTLCEVEVYASPEVAEPPPPLFITTTPPPPPAPPTASVPLGGRDVVVVGDRLCWSDALLYCRRHHWDLLSLHSWEEQSEVERLLSDSRLNLTDYVWLGLRRHVMLDGWFWMSGDSMTFDKWPWGNAPNLFSSPCGGMASRGHHQWVDQPCEELLNFICQSNAESGASRVYFYSTRAEG